MSFPVGVCVRQFSTAPLSVNCTSLVYAKELVWARDVGMQTFAAPAQARCELRSARPPPEPQRIGGTHTHTHSHPFLLGSGNPLPDGLYNPRCLDLILEDGLD